MSESRKTFNSRLAEAMGVASMTAAALGKKTGIAQSTISKWKAGATPHKHTVVAIANALGVRSEWLWEGTGPRDATTTISYGEVVKGAVPVSRIEEQSLPAPMPPHLGYGRIPRASSARAIARLSVRELTGEVVKLAGEIDRNPSDIRNMGHLHTLDAIVDELRRRVESGVLDPSC